MWCSGKGQLGKITLQTYACVYIYSSSRADIFLLSFVPKDSKMLVTTCVVYMRYSSQALHKDIRSNFLDRFKWPHRADVCLKALSAYYYCLLRTLQTPQYLWAKSNSVGWACGLRESRTESWCLACVDISSGFSE